MHRKTSTKGLTSAEVLDLCGSFGSLQRCVHHLCNRLYKSRFCTYNLRGQFYMSFNVSMSVSMYRPACMYVCIQHFV